MRFWLFLSNIYAYRSTGRCGKFGRGRSLRETEADLLTSPVTNNQQPTHLPVCTHTDTPVNIFINRQPTPNILSCTNQHLLPILGVSHKQFGGSVPASGHIVSINPPFSGRCHGPSKAKVAQLNDAPLRDEYVLWFDVTVDDLGWKEGIKTQENVVILPLPAILGKMILISFCL